MKRKAIKLGDTYVVSLPLPWTRRFGVEKGSELEMEETGSGGILISSGSFLEEGGAAIAVTKKMDSRRIFYSILREYLKGKRKIRVNGIGSGEQFHVIELVNRRLMGLEITEQGEDELLFSDMLRIEEASMDKLLSSMLSFIESMTEDIIGHIEDGREPGDKLLERDIVVDRTGYLIYRCCNLALRDSRYMKSTGKETSQILAISRVIKSLELIGNVLIGLSYGLNTELTPGMKKYHYPVFERNNKLNKLTAEELRKWLSFFGEMRKALVKMDSGYARELYVNRFGSKLNVSDRGFEPSKQLNYVTSQANHLNRNTSDILRDLMLL